MVGHANISSLHLASSNSKQKTFSVQKSHATARTHRRVGNTSFFWRCRRYCCWDTCWEAPHILLVSWRPPFFTKNYTQEWRPVYVCTMRRKITKSTDWCVTKDVYVLTENPTKVAGRVASNTRKLPRSKPSVLFVSPAAGIRYVKSKLQTRAKNKSSSPEA